MCMTFGCNPQIILSLFSQFELSHIFGSTSAHAYRHWVSCEHSPSYNFCQIFLQIYRCFCQGLKMCMTFGCNPQIIFVFFKQFERSNSLVHLLPKHTRCDQKVLDPIRFHEIH